MASHRLHVHRPAIKIPMGVIEFARHAYFGMSGVYYGAIAISFLALLTGPNRLAAVLASLSFVEGFLLRDFAAEHLGLPHVRVSEPNYCTECIGWAIGLIGTSRVLQTQVVLTVIAVVLAAIFVVFARLTYKDSHTEHHMA